MISRRLLRAAVLVAMAVLFGAPMTLDDVAAAPAVGEAYPPLRLPTIDGDTLDLRSLRGKKVLLIEFASW